MAIQLTQLLAEAETAQSPGEQAKALGLVYGGFGGWIDPDTRVVMARTVDGKLVRVNGEVGKGSGEDLGRVAILNFDPALLQSRADSIPKERLDTYHKLLSRILQFGGDFIIFTARSQEKDVALYLKKIGITAGVKLAPFLSSESQKKRMYVEKKIKSGYSHIQYFDFDSNDIAAIESLKPPYNKLNVRIETFDIPTLTGEQNASPE